MPRRVRRTGSTRWPRSARSRGWSLPAAPSLILRGIPGFGRGVTFETVAKQAGVSRSWLYAQPDLRAEIERLRAAHRREPRSPVPARQRTSDASLLRRLEAANARIRRLTEENQQLREQLARALGEQRAATTRTNSPRAGASNPVDGHPVPHRQRQLPRPPVRADRVE
ncbi:DUF6262 family protein [Streptomyces sp. NPDC101152]|uniref:DUF6262 family protein n=1 Tax=Streptomyces sp. NPDC101152 TaxID=3366116 RepID=UPI00382C0BC5